MVMVEPPETISPLLDELQRGAAEGERIDARMLEEALVLIGEQHVEITRIDLIARGGEPPAALARDVGAEQFAVAVDHGLGEFQIAAERGRSERVDQAPRCADGHASDGGKTSGRIEGSTAPRPLLTFEVRATRAARRLIVPVTRRAERAVLARSGEGGFSSLVHLADCTLTAPVPVRPKRSGRYMSSISACGST